VAPDSREDARVLARPRVVRVRAEGEWLEGALVRWAPEALLHEAGARDVRPASDIEALLDEVGDAAVTDASGSARLPESDQRVCVSARRGELFTYATLEPGGSEPVLLTLSADHTVEIQVVDLSGRPVGDVPVGISVSLPRDEERQWRSRTRPADGIAELAHAQVLLEGALQRGTVFAELLLPHVRRPDDPEGVSRVAFSNDPWPGRPLQLVLPATGSVTVRLLDASGAPLARPARVALSHATVNDGPATTRERVFVEETVQGVARFRHVGLGLQLAVTAEPVEELLPKTVVVLGPQAAGQSVDVPLRLEDRWPVLVGRLVDEGGRALPERSVSVLARMAGRRTARASFVSDGAGRFRCAIDLRGVDAPPSLALLAAATATDAARTADVALPVPGPDGLDLGEVELRVAVRIASGRVVDGANEPVEGASVRAEVGERDERGRMRWAHADSMQPSVSDGAGRFEVRGFAPATGEVRLIATKPGWIDTGPVMALPGAEDLVLRLERTSAVAGRLLLGQGVEPGLLQVRAFWLRPDPLGGELRRNSAGTLEGGGAFEIANVPPGRVDVEVTLAGMGRPLEVVRDVLVRGGEVARDRRLDPLDLTGDLFAYRIEVVDGLGQPVSSGYVATCNEAGGSPGMAHALRNGAATVIALQPTVDLEVRAPGHATLELAGVDGDRLVVLEPALRVRMRLADDVRLPRSPVVLQAKLVPAGGGGRFRLFDGARSLGWSTATTAGGGTFGSEREITALVGRLGPQELHFVLATRGTGSDGDRIVPPATGLRIVIGPEDDDRVLVVAPSQEAYEQALVEIGG
jgi:hypothetical protein